MSVPPVMIYHVPYPLNPHATSASGIRPVKMRQAFERIGYQVIEISGLSDKRKTLIRGVKAQIRKGLKIDFVYSEADTTPLALTDPDLSMHPFMDTNFLRWCRKQGIPVGLFYRDIYWRYPEYDSTVGKLKATGIRLFHYLELFGYRTSVDIVYLPSLEMADDVPFIPKEICSALPPGGDIVDDDRLVSGLHIFYVGGIGIFYRLHELVKAINSSATATLTICTPRDQWEAEKHEYPEGEASERIKIVHANVSDLSPLYEASNVGSLFVEPDEYRKFAVSFKLYEYLGRGKPIIAARETFDGAFVEAHGIGWAIPYEKDALIELLERLVEHPEEVTAQAENAKQVRKKHTWEARAIQVKEELLKLKNT